MPIDSVGRNSGQSIPHITPENIESTKQTELGTSPSVDANSGQATASSESAAKEARSRMLEGQVQEKMKQAELQSQLQNTKTPEQTAQHKERIHQELDQVEQNLTNATVTREKITSHLNGAQKEIQQIRSGIQDLRNQTQQLNEELRKLGEPGATRARNDPNHPLGRAAMELQNKKLELETKLDKLIQDKANLIRDALPGAGVSLDTSALRGASLETKLQGAESLDRHLKDLLHGTGGGSIQVSIGGTIVNAKGLDDYIAKLQKLHAQLQAEERK